MKKHFMMVLAVLVAVAIAAPAFAVEFKYGGLYRLRYQSNDNVADANDDLDDNGNWIDQRLRMYFTFIASERLQLVTKWELDTLWGEEASGGDSGADSVNLEMKNVYIDFFIPNTPTRAILGVQGISLMSGWIIDDDFSAARLVTPMAPVEVTLGYIAAQNEDVTDESENIDDWYLSLAYADGPLKANLVGFYQYGHKTNVSTFDQFPVRQDRASANDFGRTWDPLQDQFSIIDDNHLIDLGFSASYQTDMFGAWLNFVKNFGEYDVNDTTVVSNAAGSDRVVYGEELEDVSYEGWMIEAGANFFLQNFTFTVGGFLATGDDYDGDGDSDGNYRYPDGASHYWAEIMGLGTLDVNVGGAGADDRVRFSQGYSAWDAPSNIWTVTGGIAWQALKTTKLTFNYYYIATDESVPSVVADGVVLDTDDTIGHEFDFYLDQDVVDGLQLRLVGAYLMADDAYSIFEDDDDVYELGARLQWAF